MKNENTTKHKWSFFKAGGGYQAEIKSGADIANIGSLDQTLWAALACPTKGVYFDHKTLAMLDTNGDGRLRSPEIVAGCEWVCARLKNSDTLIKNKGTLEISNIADGDEEGRALLSAARRVLLNLGKDESQGLTPQDFDDETKIYSDSPFNADGVITEGASEKPEIKAAIRAIISVIGALPDRSGADGLGEDGVKNFDSLLEAHLAWREKKGAATHPFGDATEAMHAAFSAVEKKLDEYFELAEILSFDLAAECSINAGAEKLCQILANEESRKELASLPLAKVAPKLELALDADINPAWKNSFEDFKSIVISKLLPDTEVLTMADWKAIKVEFAPFVQWLSESVDGGISSLSPEDFALVSAPETRAELDALIAKDWSVKADVDNVSQLHKLVRLNANLAELLANFVSFKAFYKRDGLAMFQVGRLFFDERECDLCIKVDDAARHASLSPMSYLYLIYCNCTRIGEEPFSIAAAITAGDADNITEGRNGIFYDRQGRDWDATVTKVISNPISVRQAFWSPYKRFVKWISETVAKRASAADAAADSKLTSGAEGAASTDPKSSKKMDIGTVAAIGVAVGGLTTAFGLIFQRVTNLDLWEYPLILVGLILLISLPSMVLAAMKLRMRNLGPLLDANMWAVNTRARLSFRLGADLTRTQKLPRGSGAAPDPYDNRHPYFKIFLLALVLGAMIIGSLEYEYSFVRKHFGAKEKAAQTEQTKAESAAQAAPAQPADGAVQAEAK